MDHHTADMAVDTATRATTADTHTTGTSVACTEGTGINYIPLEQKFSNFAFSGTFCKPHTRKFIFSIDSEPKDFEISEMTFIFLMIGTLKKL